MACPRTGSGKIIEAMRAERYRFQPARRMLDPEKEREEKARSGCRHGRISSSAKWSACYWKRITSRSSPTIRTVSVPAGAATPH